MYTVYYLVYAKQIPEEAIEVEYDSVKCTASWNGSCKESTIYNIEDPRVDQGCKNSPPKILENFFTEH